MKIITKIQIDQPSHKVWSILADDFDRVDLWMSDVKHSYRTDNANKTQGAPMDGRVCQFSEKPTGLAAQEKIVDFDDNARRMVVKVVPVNAPRLLPIHHNMLTMEVFELPDGNSEVFWTLEPELKSLAKPFSLLIAMGMKRGFTRILGELKSYAEGQQDVAADPA